MLLSYSSSIDFLSISYLLLFFFFFSSRRRHTRLQGDWSSDVCSSDLITAAIALGVLFYLNWRLTLIAILILGCFGGGMAYAFAKLRPLFRDRGKLNADVTGRLGETLGGIRIVKAYRAERSERLVFTRGANTRFRNIATTMTGISAVGAFATIIIGAIGILMILEGGHAILSNQ